MVKTTFPEKEYDVYFRRNNKERYWELESKTSLYGFYELLKKFLENTTEKELFIKLVKKEKIK